MAEVKITILGEDRSGPVFKSVQDAGVQASNMIKSAFDALGIKSAEGMEQAKFRINSAFDALKNSHASTQNEITRAESARAKAIEDIDKQNFATRGSMLDKFKENWLGITASLAAAWVATDWMRGSMEMALEEEKAFNKLKIQVEGLGVAYDSVSGPINSAIEGTEKYARVTGGNAAKALQQLIFVSGDLQGSMNNLNLVYDLAYQKGISNEEAATLIGKAMTGNVSMLGRYIPELHNLGVTLGTNADAIQTTAYAMGLLKDKSEESLRKMTEHQKMLKDSQKTWEEFREKLGNVAVVIAGGIGQAFKDLQDSIEHGAPDFKRLAAGHESAAIAAVKDAAAHKMTSVEIAAMIKSANDAALALEKLSPPRAADASNDITKQSDFALKQLEDQYKQGDILTQAYYDQREAIIYSAYSRQFDIESKEYDRIAKQQQDTDKNKEYPKWLELEAQLIVQNGKLKDLTYANETSDLSDVYAKLKDIEAEQTRLLKQSQDIAGVGLHTEGLKVDTIQNQWDKQTAQMTLAYKQQKQATEDHIADLYDQWSKDGKSRSELIAKYEADNLQLQTKSAYDQLELEKQIALEKMQVISTSMGQVAQLMMTGNRKEFEEGKNLAEAEAGVETALAIIKAYGQLGPVYGTIAAVGLVAELGLQEKKIANQQYTGRAVGGPVEAGGSYLVGEQGPELIKMGAAGTVIPNNALATAGKDQLDATHEQTAAIKENTTAVTKVADGFTKIAGMLTNFVGYFTELSTSLNNLAPSLQGNFLSTLKDKLPAGVQDSSATWGKLTSYLEPAMTLLIKTSEAMTNWIIGGKQTNVGQGATLGYSGGQVQGGQYVETHTSGGLFHRGHNDISTTPFDNDFQSMLQNNSQVLKDAITNAAAAIGQGAAGINAATLSMEQISLKDLSPEDQAKAVEAWFQKLANTFADGVAGLDSMKKPGEDSFTALIRLSTALQAVNENTAKFGGTVLKLSLISASAASDLVDQMGGMQAYLSKTDAYFNLFYSSGEQARLKAEMGAKTAGDAFASLGMVMPRTAEGFRNIISGLDLTTEAGRNAYTALMNVAAGADAVYKLEKDRYTFEQDLRIREMKANGEDTTLYELRLKQDDDMRRAEELGIDTTHLATVQAREYANAVATAGQTMATMSTATTKLKDSLSSLVDSQLSIAQKIVSIMSGPASGLSPEAAYLQAQQQFSAASQPGHEADLSSAADALLSASKNYNASGPAYQADLNNVLKTLNEAIGGTGSPILTEAQNQVLLLQEIRDYLKSGVSASAVMAFANQTGSPAIITAASNYLAGVTADTGGSGGGGGSTPQYQTRTWAKAGVDLYGKYEQYPGWGIGSWEPAYKMEYDVAPPFDRIQQADLDLLKGMVAGTVLLPPIGGMKSYAKGGLASGWSIVGEEGPEIVNFSNPGRVYSSSQTKAALNGDNTELIDEVRKLRSEVVNLRAEVRLHGTAQVRVSQEGFQQTIKLSKSQADSAKVIASKTRLAALADRG